MKHKLRDLLECFEDVEVVYIMTEGNENHICIKIKKKGSWFFLKPFLDEEFKLECYSDKLKALQVII